MAALDGDAIDRGLLRADVKVDANLLLALIQNATATRMGSPDTRALLNDYSRRANKALDREQHRLAKMEGLKRA